MKTKNSNGANINFIANFLSGKFHETIRVICQSTVFAEWTVKIKGSIIMIIDHSTLRANLSLFSQQTVVWLLLFVKCMFQKKLPQNLDFLVQSVTKWMLFGANFQIFYTKFSIFYQNFNILLYFSALTAPKLKFQFMPPGFMFWFLFPASRNLFNKNFQSNFIKKNCSRSKYFPYLPSISAFIPFDGCSLFWT